MKVNKLLKNLSKNPNYLRGLSPNVTKLLMQFMTTKEWEIGGLAPCQFFDFGFVSEEALLEEWESTFEAYLEGFLRLPAPLCVFEYQTKNISYPGVSKDPRIEGSMVCFYATPQGFNQLRSALNADNPCSDYEKIDFSTSGTDDERSIIGTYLLYYSKPPINAGKGWSFVEGFDQINFEDSKTQHARTGDDAPWSASFIKVPNEAGHRGTIGNKEDDLDRVHNALFAPLIVFLARLNARGMERKIIHAPEGLNKRRIKKGIAPHVSYTTVKVAPYCAPLGHSGPREEVSAKRYHFRRGHIRRFANGATTWVRECFVGCPEAGGRVEHTYEVSA